jgi:hypothetical protein
MLMEQQFANEMYQGQTSGDTHGTPMGMLGPFNDKDPMFEEILK